MFRMSRETICIAAAFAAVYIIWGSTYLSIKVALDWLPPYVMAAVRFVIAGGIMYICLATSKGFDPPTFRQWLFALVVGGLLIVGGNGGVIMAEQTISSGTVSLLAAATPIWMALLNWIRPGGRAPGPLVGIGLLAGIAGVGILVGPGALSNSHGDCTGIACVLVGSLCWAIGSILSKDLDLPKNIFVVTAMEMLCGGLLCCIVAIARGELTQVRTVSLSSAAAVAFLIVFGSIIAFSAYVWLLRVADPTKVGTYAYVNPVIALLLGWFFAHEPVAANTLIAAGVIVASVAAISSDNTKSRIAVNARRLRT